MRNDRSATLPRWLDQEAGPGLWLAIALMTAAVAIADYLTGPYVYITDFYMIPVLALGWFVSLRSAVLLTLATMLYRVLLYSTVWRTTGPGLLLSYWNLAAESGFVAVIVILMAWLKRALTDAHRLALTDDLTGAANRRAFYQQARQEIARTDRPLSLAYLDVDDFKQINDRLGHEKGDRVLALLVQILQAAVRPTDFVARLGGDEFAVLLPNTGPADAQWVAMRLRNRLQDAMQAETLPVTFSVGMLTYQQPPASVDELVSRADALMYAAKARGKNVVVAATAPLAEPAA
jgi:diguanylate cyclase (GGDEF)-like protein